MNFDNLLEMLSNSHKTDKSLEYKAKIKNTVSYLEERKSLFTSVNDKPVDIDDNKYEHDDDNATIPYQGPKLEGLRVCMSVISNMGNYDWNRRRFIVQNAFDELTKLANTPGYATDAKKLRDNLIKNVRKVSELFQKHEDGGKLDDDEKQKIIDFSSDCSYMITYKNLIDAQNDLDSDVSTKGNSGGKVNMIKINNLIPCNMKDRGRAYKGLIVVSNPKEKRGTLVWITDNTLNSDGENNESDSIARKIWIDKVEKENIDNRFKYGSINLIDNDGFKVDKKDASILRSLDVDFNDSLSAKEDVQQIYMETYEYLRDQGLIGSNGRGKKPNLYYGEDVLTHLAGWKEVLGNIRFWQRIDV